MYAIHQGVYINPLARPLNGLVGEKLFRSIVVVLYLPCLKVSNFLKNKNMLMHY